MLKATAHKVGRAYIRKVAAAEHQQKRAARSNERPVEYAFVFDWLNRLQPRAILDVGTGTSALPAMMWACGFQVDAIDNMTDYWPHEQINRHFDVWDVDIQRPSSVLRGKKYDVVTCISVIEHIVDHQAAFRSMLSLLSEGGYLLLTCPYNESEYVANVYDRSDSYAHGAGLKYGTRQSTRETLDLWLDGTGAEIVHQEYWQFHEAGRPWSCGPLVRPPKKTGRDEPHQLTLLAFKSLTR